MTPALAGSLAGLLHVVSGPDHLVAVAPLAIHRPGLGARVGMAWGFGHATGVIVLGLLGVVARTVFSLQLISNWSEVLVGGALMGIGVWALMQSREVVVHRHTHSHNDERDDNHHTLHEHLHVHSVSEAHTGSAHYHHGRGAFAVGILHGAAGTGHIFGVIPALALAPHQGLLYLMAYGAAAVIAMTSFGAALGLLGHRISPRHLSLTMKVFGAAAVCLGCFWIASGWP